MDKFVDKYSDSIPVAASIAFTSLAKVNIINDLPAFVFALDVVAFAVLIYCYRKKLSVMEISIIAALASPLMRFVAEYQSDEDVLLLAKNCLPDAIFFISYGVIFLFLVRILSTKSRITIGTFVVFAYICDFSANTIESIILALMHENSTISFQAISIIAMVAFARSLFIYLILFVVEHYAKGQLLREQGKKFQILMNQSVTLNDEFYIIKHNMSYVEDVMKEAYSLYNDIRDDAANEDYTRRALDIARGAHEIKGMYRGVIDSLNSISQISEKMSEYTGLKMSNLLRFIKSYVKDFSADLGKSVYIEARSNVDYKIANPPKLLSIIRNLVANSIEAMDKKGGMVELTVEEYLLKNSGERMTRIVVSDNGSGIPEDSLEDIFISGYSTKMNYETGYVQRGLGLSLIKAYIEDEYNGSIEVESELGKGARFTVTIPSEMLKEED